MSMHWFSWFNRMCPFGFGGFFSIWHFLILLSVAVLVIWGITSVRKARPKDDSAIDALKILYVNGEISEEEFLKRKSFVER